MSYLTSPSRTTIERYIGVRGQKLRLWSGLGLNLHSF